MKSANINSKDLVSLIGMVLVLSIPTFLHCWWYPADTVAFILIDFAIALFVCSLILWVPWRCVRWLFFTMLFVGTLFESAHLLVYDGDMASTGYLRSLFMTTPYEADGAVWRIVCQHAYVVLGVAVAYLIVSVLLFCVRPSLSWQKWVIPISAALCLIVCVSFPSRVYLPLNVYVQAKETLRQRNERERNIAQAETFTYNASRGQTPSDREIYLLIMDESLRYDHISFEGDHYRLTMPRMGQLSNLVSFTDYYATGVFTMYAVPMMLTRATPDTFVTNYRELGVQQAFAEAGFKTYWLTNEAQLVSDGVSDYIARGADVVRVKSDFDIPHALDSLCATADKLFFIVHLWGNHQFYINSLSATSRYSPDVLQTTAVRGEEMYANSYDNCILATDSLLSAITDCLKQKDCIAQWIFTSDHGEGPIGDHGGAHGYTYPSSGEYHVPLMVWFSDIYQTVFPDKIANLHKHRTAPFCADHLFWSVLDMADIRIDSTLQTEGMSVFGDTVLPHQRTLLLPDGKSIMALD